MVSSHVEEVTKQDQGRDPRPPTWGRKDKSRDAITIFEGWIAKLELVWKTPRGVLTFLEQSIEEAMGDLRGQINDLQEGMQGSSVHAVLHKEFMAFQGKVLSVLNKLELRVDALTRHVEAQDEQMRQELAIYKATVSTRVMATHEGSEDSHTMGGGEKVSPSTTRYGKGKAPFSSRKFSTLSKIQNMKIFNVF